MYHNILLICPMDWTIREALSHTTDLLLGSFFSTFFCDLFILYILKFLSTPPTMPGSFFVSFHLNKMPFFRSMELLTLTGGIVPAPPSP
jgi:hypothetical protein